MTFDRRLVLAGVLALAPLLAPVGAYAEQKTLRVGIMSAEGRGRPGRGGCIF